MEIIILILITVSLFLIMMEKVCILPGMKDEEIWWYHSHERGYWKGWDNDLKIYKYKGQSYRPIKVWTADH